MPGVITTADFTNQLLKEAREILADTNAQVAEIPFDDFKNSRLPPVDPSMSRTIMDKLVQSTKGGITGVGGVMHGYSNITPGKHSGHETAAFAHLCQFISFVIDLTLEHEEAESWIAHYWKQTPVQTERANFSRLDSYIHLLEDTDTIGWHQILATGEFKKSKRDARENWIRLLWGCNHVLRNDPRRRFTFGLTAEDDEARVWFFSRAAVIVSEPFKFIENPGPLVIFILSLTLRQPPNTHLFEGPVATTVTASGALGLERLGFDSTVNRIPVDDRISYEIVMDGTLYVLEEVLSDYKVDELIGRATRVWLVHDKEHPDQQCVMKDVWLENGAKHEGDILEEIKNLVEGTEDPDLLEQFHRHFIMPITDQIIGETVRGVDGHAKIRYLCLIDTPTAQPSTPKSTASGSVRTHTTGVTPVLQPTIPPPRRFADRKQYRILFPGVLQPLHLIRNAREQAQVVADLPQALNVLRAVGYVHRDLSNTNAMRNPVTGRGVLTDFEYAVPYGQAGEGDVKTGTPFFWSVEVEQDGTYLYLPGLVRPKPDLTKLVPLSANIEDMRTDDEAEPPPGNIFFHSVLHDLESVWWISLWTLLFFVPTAESPIDQDIKPDRRDLYLKAFPAKERAGTRKTFLDMDSVRANALSSCKSIPSGLRVILDYFILQEVPKALSAGHRLAQASLTKSGDTIGGQHPAFLTAIEEIQQLFSEFLTHLDTVLHSDVGTVRPMTPMPQDILILTHGPDDVDKPQSVEDAAEDADERDSKRRKAV